MWRREVRRMEQGSRRNIRTDEGARPGGPKPKEHKPRRRRRGSTPSGRLCSRDCDPRARGRLEILISLCTLTIARDDFLSIMVMFCRCTSTCVTRLERDVQKLTERSIRLQEQRYQRTTHSTIVERARGAGMSFPTRRRRARSSKLSSDEAKKERSKVKSDILLQVRLHCSSSSPGPIVLFLARLECSCSVPEVAYNAGRLASRIFTEEVIPAQRGSILFARRRTPRHLDLPAIRPPSTSRRRGWIRSRPSANRCRLARETAGCLLPGQPASAYAKRFREEHACAKLAGWSIRARHLLPAFRGVDCA